VYRARDTRLERTVAVKVLPSRMSASPESRQRFERETKMISQLSHPHICALYDVRHEGETEYIVNSDGRRLGSLSCGEYPYEGSYDRWKSFALTMAVPSRRTVVVFSTWL
jgi:serine/threonine protein kinase